MRAIGRSWMRKEQNGQDERKLGNKDWEEEQKGRKTIMDKKRNGEKW